MGKLAPTWSAVLCGLQTTEPLPSTSPLWTAKGVVITPHVAAVSFPDIIADVFVDNMDRWRGLGCWGA